MTASNQALAATAATANIPAMGNVMPTYGRLPIAFVRGEGCYLYDTNGRRYFDALAGVAVNALGHSHAGFIAAVTKQLNTLVHTSNYYEIPLQTQLAETLCQRSGMERVFFNNSGAEANEAAIKIARRFGFNKGIAVPHILVMENAFHGRTMGALTATYNKKYQEGFGPLLDGFVRVPYNDVAAVKAAIEATPQLVAILVEPIVGEGGVVKPADNYLNELRALCDTHDMLLMLDEVQTGNGRTGAWFAYQHNGILPDVLSTAKGLGNGFPIGACLTRGRANVLSAGHHGSTFGGSPLAAAAGIAVYKALANEDLLGNAKRRGEQIDAGFRKALADCKGVKDIRSKGLMIGVELDRPCKELVERARSQGLLLNVTADSVIRLVPPLTLNQEEADFIVNVVSRIVKEFCDGR
ncbi:MAG: acetylornithine aminotransferase [Pseudomonadota bacterium]|jgi:acetylornithine aminotransferase